MIILMKQTLAIMSPPQVDAIALALGNPEQKRTKTGVEYFKFKNK